MHATSSVNPPQTSPQLHGSPETAAQQLSRTALLWRCARLIAHLIHGQLLVTAVALRLIGRQGPERLTQAWNRRLLAILGLRITVHGAPAVEHGRMTVANHVSWLDIPLIAACEPTRFVAKSEIRRWPIAGWLATAAGTFYIRRGKGSARPLMAPLVSHLQAGGAVTVFPEGTTSDGRSVLPFHARLLAAPQQAASLVQPVAIRYGLGASGARVAPFIGDDELFTHVLRVLREPALRIDIHYCQPLAAARYNRDELAAHCQAAVSQALQGLESSEQPCPTLAVTQAA